MDWETTVLPECICGLDTVPTQVPAGSFVAMDDTCPETRVKRQGVRKSQNRLEKELKLEDSHFLISKLTAAKRVLLARDRQTDRWNRAERPEVSLHVYGQLLAGRSSQGKNGLQPTVLG